MLLILRARGRSLLLVLGDLPLQCAAYDPLLRLPHDPTRFRPALPPQPALGSFSRARQRGYVEFHELCYALPTLSRKQFLLQTAIVSLRFGIGEPTDLGFDGSFPNYRRESLQ